MIAITASPGLTCVTPPPTDFTTPATSLPGENGSGGFTWYLFWMISTSGKLTLAALTDTTTSPAPASSGGRSSTTSDSGGPYALHKTAFMTRAHQRSPECIGRRCSAREDRKRHV